MGYHCAGVLGYYWPHDSSEGPSASGPQGTETREKGGLLYLLEWWKFHQIHSANQ